MKDYFKFNLQAQKFLPVWLTFMVLVIVPYIFLAMNVKNVIPPDHPLGLLEYMGILFLLIIIAYAILFYMIKLVIEGVEFKGKSFVFDGSFGQFIGQFLLGLFWSIITLGIYLPWFITKIRKFFVNNTSHDSNKLEFAGTAGKLFKIMLLTTFLPIMLLTIVMAGIKLKTADFDPNSFGLFTNLITLIIMIPYLYYFYNWLVNIKFKDYTIRWETNFWNSCGKLLWEIILSIITVGIYYPYAILRLYKYFIEKTFAVSENSKKGFGFELEPREDFLFLWGQILLTIITLGIYYPCAYCKITSRILGKTFTEQLPE
ncbi:MAG: DUF898 family protein [Bacteroidota bacterium]|nr:DUF898 family protein [Bacteroidota bacterium]